MAVQDEFTDVWDAVAEDVKRAQRAVNAREIARTVNSSMSPKGVEHGMPGLWDVGRKSVNSSMSPKGVEHRYYRGVLGYYYDVNSSMSPKGVEH